MLKEHIVETGEGRGAPGVEGEEFGNVENHNIAEVHLTFFVEVDESCINTVCAVSGTECEHALAFHFGISLDIPYNLAGNEVGPVGGCLEDASVELFITAQGSELDFAVGVVVPSGNSVQFDLAA